MGAAVVRDYRPLVSRTPPKGLLAFTRDELDTAGLVYQMEWVQDGSIEAMLVNPGRKTKVVRCTCSACERDFVAAYTSSSCRHPDVRYGFIHPDEHGAAEHGDCILCPICGSPVTVQHAPTIGRGEFVSAETNVMSASLLDGEPGDRPLVLTGWSVRRLVNRYGRDRYDIRPLEAYVFERQDCYKLSGWVNSYSGTAGYFISVSRDWRQSRDWSESWGRISRIFGLTPELVEDSCLSNSKFDVYMTDTAWGAPKSPVPFLRLYQKYPQLENLVVQRCSYLLDRLFDKNMQNSKWESNRKGCMELPEIHFEETRPAQMLGLTKEELRVMQDQCWDVYHWRVYVKAKAVGDRLKIPEDITLLHQYGAEDIEKIIGRAPVGKTLRYLMRAIEEWGCANDPYNEYGGDLADEDGDLLTVSHLADYWTMAEQAKWNLNDPAVRWPRNLFDAHDRASAASKVVLSKELASRFKERASVLSKYAYTSGPLMIRPAASQKELTREGSQLRHCVAGYGNDVALGTTAILFVRHTWAPRTPYFTLEFDETKETVKQNRGRRNCARTPEVEAFEKEWLAWVRGGCKRNIDGTPVGAKPPIKENPAHKKEVAVA